MSKIQPRTLDNGTFPVTMYFMARDYHEKIAKEYIQNGTILYRVHVKDERFEGEYMAIIEDYEEKYEWEDIRDAAITRASWFYAAKEGEDPTYFDFSEHYEIIVEKIEFEELETA